MAVLSFDALLRSLKQGRTPEALYYLHGDEDVLKDEALRALVGPGPDPRARAQMGGAPGGAAPAHARTGCGGAARPVRRARPRRARWGAREARRPDGRPPGWRSGDAGGRRRPRRHATGRNAPGPD